MTKLIDFNKDEVEVDPDKTVDLIASGYEWVCPSCDKFNRQFETSLAVTCEQCEKSFAVSDIEHAYP